MRDEGNPAECMRFLFCKSIPLRPDQAVKLEVSEELIKQLKAGRRE